MKKKYMDTFHKILGLQRSMWLNLCESVHNVCVFPGCVCGCVLIIGVIKSANKSWYKLQIFNVGLITSPVVISLLTWSVWVASPFFLWVFTRCKPWHVSSHFQFSLYICCSLCVWSSIPPLARCYANEWKCEDANAMESMCLCCTNPVERVWGVDMVGKRDGGGWNYEGCLVDNSCLLFTFCNLILALGRWYKYKVNEQ